MHGSTVATGHPLQPPHTRPLSPFPLPVGVRDMSLLLTLGTQGYHGCAILEGREEVKGRQGMEREEERDRKNAKKEKMDGERGRTKEHMQSFGKVLGLSWVLCCNYKDRLHS